MNKWITKGLIWWTHLGSFRSANLRNSFARHSHYSVSPTNTVVLENTSLYSCFISIQGSNNVFCCKNAELDNSHFLKFLRLEIYGNNNKVLLDDDIELRNTRIVVRGDNCLVHIGAHSLLNGGSIVCMGKDNSINIGTDCMLSEQIQIWSTDSHPITDSEGTIINPSKPINIGNHVWIGLQAAILKGVNIGDNVVVGMRSLVSKDIPANCICAGTPAKVIKENTNWIKQFIDQ